MTSLYRLQPSGRLDTFHLYGYWPGGSPPVEQNTYVPKNKRSHLIEAVPATIDYQFTVTPYRDVDQDINITGRITGGAAQPHSGPYKPENSLFFDGTVAALQNGLIFSKSGGASSVSLFDGTTSKTVSYDTFGAPSVTGANASGTWGISITGSAASATTATSATLATSSNGLTYQDTRNVADVPNSAVFAPQTLRADFKTTGNAGSPPVTTGTGFSHILTLNGWTAANVGGGGFQTQLASGNGLAWRQAASTTTWGNWYKLYDATDADTAGTANKLVLRDGSGNLFAAGGTFASQLQCNSPNNVATGGAQIYLNGANGNRIDFNSSGVAPPTFTTRSVGTKLCLYPSINASQVDYALGIDGSTLWFSVPDTGSTFKWYGGTTNYASLSNGNLGLTGTIVASNFSAGSSVTGSNTGDQTITLTGDVTGTGGGSFPVTISAGYAENLRANLNLSGGGTITYNGSGVFGWTTRFIVIANGTGSNFSTAGYFDIAQPTSGTITGVGGASSVTATAAGIPLAPWTALYYILPIGSVNTSLAANFRLVTYSGGAIDVPDEWVLIAVNNGDANVCYCKAVPFPLYGGSSFTNAGGTTGPLIGMNLSPAADNTYNLGGSSLRYANMYAVTFNGTATAAQYADLAERYHADTPYEPGTVLVIGGPNEVTACAEDQSRKVAGVVSTNPALMMNSEAGDDATHPYVALRGRVPCCVVGPVSKGDILVTSTVPGHARAATTDVPANCTVGKALEDFSGPTGIIEIMV